MRKTWAVPGTLVLGALGSALWELGMEPTGEWAWHFVLTLVTLGSETLKNSIYQEAARGFHEHVSSSAYTLLLMGFVGAIVSFVRFAHQTVSSNTEDDESPVSAKTTEENQAHIEAQATEIKRLTGHLRILNRILFPVCLLLVEKLRII